MGKTYYKVLGVSPGNSQDEIKQAYRRLAKENHPDLHPGDEAAEERFKEIGEAWETLGDAEKRKKYDRKLAGDTVRTQAKKPAGRKNAPMGKVDINEMMRGFGDMFTQEHYQQEVGKKVKKSPIDADELFNRFMGFKK